ncbi:MAG: hypothetical protein ACLTK0_03960 [Anaerovoracaceae bacterium]
MFSDVGSGGVSEKGESSLTGFNLKEIFPGITEEYPLFMQVRQEKLFPDTKKRC